MTLHYRTHVCLAVFCEALGKYVSIADHRKSEAGCLSLAYLWPSCMAFPVLH